MMAFAVVLLLSPTLAEPGELRLVATGLGDEPVVWVLDGVEVARTRDREAATIAVGTGLHALQAFSNATGRWQAVARPDPAGDGAAYVPAWTATHDPAPAADHGWATWPRNGLSWALGGLALVVLGWPGRRGLEVLRRRPRA